MQVATLEGPRGVLRTAHFDPTSHWVVGASWDGAAPIWDASSPYQRWSAPPLSDDCGFVSSFEPDRRFVAIGCWDQRTRVFDTAHDQLLAELPSVTPVDGDVAFPAVSAAGDRAAIARGETVEVYELPGGRLDHVIRHRAPVSAVAFAPTGRDVISGAIDGSVLLTQDGQAAIELPPSTGGIDVVALLGDGRAITADAHGRLRVIDGDRGAVLAELPLPVRVQRLRPLHVGTACSRSPASSARWHRRSFGTSIVTSGSPIWPVMLGSCTGRGSLDPATRS